MSEPQATPTPAPAPAPATPPAPEPSRAEQRIGQLVRQKNDAERLASGLETQMSDLRRQNQELMALVQGSQAPKQAPRAADRGRLPDVLAGNASDNGFNQPNIDLRQIVADAVREVVAPLQQEREAERQNAALMAAQRNSFNSVLADVPGLAQDGSPEQQLFDRLWKGNPELQRMDNGPALVATMVQGLLASSPAQSTQTARKTLAATHEPLSHQRLGALPGAVDANQTALQALAETGSQRPLGDEEMLGLIGLKLGTMRVKP